MNHDTDVRDPVVLADDLLAAKEALDKNPLATLAEQHAATQTLLSVIPSLTAYGQCETRASLDIRAILQKRNALPVQCREVIARLELAIHTKEWPISERGKAEVTY